MKIHFKRRLLAATILGALLHGGLPSAAQTVDLQFAPAQLKQVGPSPQAASMTRYADASVSYGLGPFLYHGLAVGGVRLGGRPFVPIPSG